MIIRKYKKEDNRKFIEMCGEFYNSEAVLHPIGRQGRQAPLKTSPLSGFFGKGSEKHLK